MTRGRDDQVTMIPAPPDHERGFILITAMWLLVLCSAIAALLMLRARNTATAISGAERVFRERLLVHDAAETAIADLLFDGGRSRWAIVPTTASLTIDGQPMSVTVTSEAGRVDVNDSDPRIIGSALQGMGAAPATRHQIISEITAKRAGHKRFTSSAALVQLLAPAQAATPRWACLAEQFTLDSGLDRPSETAMSPTLAAALGVATSGSGTAASSASLRLVATAGAGQSLTMVFNLSGTASSPYLLRRFDGNGRSSC